jgi:hypothetical protein
MWSRIRLSCQDAFGIASDSTNDLRHSSAGRLGSIMALWTQVLYFFLSILSPIV